LLYKINVSEKIKRTKNMF